MTREATAHLDAFVPASALVLIVLVAQIPSRSLDQLERLTGCGRVGHVGCTGGRNATVRREDEQLLSRAGSYLRSPPSLGKEGLEPLTMSEGLSATRPSSVRTL